MEPSTIEFWQGQSNRIHDRLRFVQAKDFLSHSLELIRFRRATDGEQLKEGSVKGEDGWLIERLAP